MRFEGNNSTFPPLAIIAMRNTLILLLLMLFQQAVAQRPGPDMSKELNGHSYSPLAKLDGRFTTLGGKLVRIGGVKAGLEIDRLHEVGLGLHYMFRGTLLNYPSLFRNGRRIERDARTSILYGSAYYEYKVHTTRRYLYMVHLTQGAGRVRYDVFETRLGANSAERRQHLLLITEPGVSVERVLNPYFGIVLGAGYRFAMGGGITDGGPNLNGPFLVTRLKIYFWSVYSDFTKDDLRRRSLRKLLIRPLPPQESMEAEEEEEKKK